METKVMEHWVLTSGKYGEFYAPANYEAETAHLLKVYGRTNVGRQYKPSEPIKPQPKDPKL